MSFVSALVALSAWALCAHEELSFQRSRLPPESDLLYLPRADVVRTLSLGHTELAADLVWVRAVVYAGGEIATRGGMKWLDRYLDTIITLDPSFERPYKWAGVITMYNGRTITNEMVRASNHYLELGAERFPRDWELPFMLGSNYLHELRSTDRAQKEAWHRIGAEYVRRAALLGGGPSWLPLLAASLYTRQGREEAAIRHLEEVLASTENPAVQAQVRERLIALKATHDAEQIETARRQLAAGLAAWAPYAPMDLFIQVGPGLPDRTLEALVGDPLLEN